MSVEMLVAFTLLTTALSISLPLVIRHGRLLESCRHYRLALDELSNQLDRITALPATDASSAVAHLSPSKFIADKLSGAKLSGQLQPVDFGERLTLHLSWEETPEHPTTVSLAAWILPAGERSPDAAVGGKQP
jgi:ribosomal protein L11 methylase PrmA